MVILLKAAVLVLIVLCIFFIAYPHACVNLIEGRQTDEQTIQDINKPLIQANQDITSGPAQPQQTQPAQVPAEYMPVITQPAVPQTTTTTTAATAQNVVNQAVSTAKTTAQNVSQAAQTTVKSVSQTAQTTAQNAQTAANQTAQNTQTALNAAIAQQQEAQAKQDVYDYNVIKRYVAVEQDYLKTHPNDSAAATAITQQVMNEYQLSDQEWREIISKANQRGWFDALRGK